MSYVCLDTKDRKEIERARNRALDVSEDERLGGGQGLEVRVGRRVRSGGVGWNPWRDWAEIGVDAAPTQLPGEPETEGRFKDNEEE